jgi:PTH1 family peptidyl-tRNA hydrolase
MAAQKPIRLFVGLGNPGAQYAETRHNAGAWFIEKLAHKLNSPLHNDKRFFGELSKTKICGEDVWLVFPNTYMNRSGQAVGALAQFFKLSPEEILVVHDELDLLPGQLKLKKGGGNAGHNGLKDIHAHLGSNDFWRARLGIGHPRALAMAQGVADFVLHRPSLDHQIAIDFCITKLLAEVEAFAKGDISNATTRLHTSMNG